MQHETRTYVAADVVHFHLTNAPFGEFSNFWPLPVPIRAGPWHFVNSEALYQAAKFPDNPELQERIASTSNAYAAKERARSVAIASADAWNARRLNVMRWVLRAKHASNRKHIDTALRTSGNSPIVEYSTRDGFWGAKPDDKQLVGVNALGRLWMELRQQLRNEDPRVTPQHALGRLPPEILGRLAEAPRATP